MCNFIADLYRQSKPLGTKLNFGVEQILGGSSSNTTHNAHPELSTRRTADNRHAEISDNPNTKSFERKLADSRLAESQNLRASQNLQEQCGQTNYRYEYVRLGADRSSIYNNASRQTANDVEIRQQELQTGKNKRLDLVQTKRECEETRAGSGSPHEEPSDVIFHGGSIRARDHHVLIRERTAGRQVEHQADTTSSGQRSRELSSRSHPSSQSRYCLFCFKGSD
jgi:hypothetical protein